MFGAAQHRITTGQQLLVCPPLVHKDQPPSFQTAPSPDQLVPLLLHCSASRQQARVAAYKALFAGGSSTGLLPLDLNALSNLDSPEQTEEQLPVVDTSARWEEQCYSPPSTTQILQSASQSLSYGYLIHRADSLIHPQQALALARAKAQLNGYAEPYQDVGQRAPELCVLGMCVCACVCVRVGGWVWVREGVGVGVRLHVCVFVCMLESTSCLLI